jgi:hypothetical protein
MQRNAHIRLNEQQFEFRNAIDKLENLSSVILVGLIKEI